MIQQRKSKAHPISLAHGKSFRGDDICEQLVRDHDGKCYLCEARLGHLFEIDHLQSQSNFPERTYDWQNLFLVCGPCNRKKKNNFDGIPNPVSTPLEECIHIVPIPNEICGKVQVRLLRDTPGGEELVRLLSRIYNGTPNGSLPQMRKCRENVFYKGYIREIGSFTKNLLAYRKSPSPSTRRCVVDLLRIDQPFLGTKYSILRDSNLLGDFAKETPRNRRH